MIRAAIAQAVLRRPQLLFAIGLAAVFALASWHMIADRRHERDDAALEQHIDSLAAFNAHAKAQLVVARRQNDSTTRSALKSAGEYHSARSAVTLDLGASTISVAGGAPEPVPPIAVSLIVQADSAIALLERALVGARAIAAQEKSRADSLELAGQLKDERPAPPRCGAKCGATLAFVAIKIVPRLFGVLKDRVRPPSLIGGA